MYILLFLVFVAFNTVNAFKPLNIKLKNNFKLYTKFKTINIIKMVNINYEEYFDKFYEENFDKNYNELNKRFENNFNNHFDKNLNKLRKAINFQDSYIVIWDESLKCDMLLYDMYLHNLNTKFYKLNSFNKKNIYKLYETRINNIQFLNSSEPWIFKNGEFIGGIFELYESLFYKSF